jgi:hypothetical protein
MSPIEVKGFDTEKMMKKIQEQQLSTDEVLKSGMDTFKNWLKAHGILKFNVSYSGYGDDGEINDVDITFSKDGKDKSHYPPDYLKFVSHSSYDESDPRYIAPHWEDAKNSMAECNEFHKSYQEILEDICYQMLSLSFGGWEINDGSSGRISWNSEGKDIEVVHEWNVTTTESDSASY